MSYRSFPSNYLPIADCAKATGVSPSCLRMWEGRYGWPKSVRHPVSNYRYYSPMMVGELKRLQALIKASGRPISDFVWEGEVHWPSPLAPKPARSQVYISALPKPITPEGHQLQRQMIEAVEQKRSDLVEKVRHEAMLLRPSDRLAVMAVTTAVTEVRSAT